MPDGGGKQSRRKGTDLDEPTFTRLVATPSLGAR